MLEKALTHENLSSALQITFHFIKRKSFMYLSCTLKIDLALSLTEKEAFQHPWPCILFICLVALNTALVFLALKKSSKHENLSSALQITFHFMRKKHLSCTWALLLKLHLATFSHWERSFSASVALDSLHLLSCTKHSISVLRSSKPVILCIEALTWLALQKSSLATFSHWERSFSASLALHSLHLLSCTKHIISVLRSSKLVICALKL